MTDEILVKKLKEGTTVSYEGAKSTTVWGIPVETTAPVCFHAQRKVCIRVFPIK